MKDSVVKFTYYEGYNDAALFKGIYKELKKTHPEINVEIVKTPSPEMGGVALPPNFWEQFVQHEITKDFIEVGLQLLIKIFYKHLFKTVTSSFLKKKKLNRNIVLTYWYPTELDIIRFDFEFSPWLTDKDFKKAMSKMGDFINNHTENRGIESAGFWKFQYDRRDYTWYDIQDGSNINDVENLLKK